MRDCLDQLRLGDTVALSSHKVGTELVGVVHGNERADGRQAPIPLRKPGQLPHIAIELLGARWLLVIIASDPAGCLILGVRGDHGAQE
jgi:hypothetical protein